MFEKLKNGDDVKNVLKEAFDMELPVGGKWGYTKEEPLIINTKDIQTSQVEFVFASMRATLEMNLTQPKESRYSAINIKEISRETFDDLEKVVYEVSGIKEDIYTQFINEYKQGYGKSGFDIDEHFKKREENTLKREVEYWFKLN